MFFKSYVTRAKATMAVTTEQASDLVAVAGPGMPFLSPEARAHAHVMRMQTRGHKPRGREVYLHDISKCEKMMQTTSDSD